MEHLISKKIDLQEQLNARKPFNNKKLGALLLDQGIINAEQLKAALYAQSCGKNAKIGAVLIGMNLVTEDQIKMSLASKLGYLHVDLNKLEPDISALAFVPKDIVEKLQILPLMYWKEKIVIAASEICPKTESSLKFIFANKYELVLANNEALNNSIKKWYSN